ncbi:MAG: hypothetical protein OXG88_02175 [Gammaproteobacteria bacterium]|nr:hypothetical protein [Gammaproteobacteria bacterium]
MRDYKSDIRPDEINHQSKHRLYVEGDEDSFDYFALNILFENKLSIKPLGPVFYLKSAAEAFYRDHPNYYYLVDRDHHDDKFIQDCWDNFRTQKKHNLIVWKRREIENYFIEPDYLINSEYCKVSKKELKRKILELSKTRLFLDAANYVVIAVREELKQNWIQKFSNLEEFPNEDAALEKLTTAIEFKNQASKVSEKVSTNYLKERFNKHLHLMTGGQKNISFGTGSWLNLIEGKNVLSQIINTSFGVPVVDGTQLSIKEKRNLIIWDLLKVKKNFPSDFIELKQLIQARLNAGNIE